MPRALASLLLLPLLSACAATDPDSLGEPATRSRSVSDSHITVLDRTPREPVDPASVVVLSYVNEPQPLPGCTVVGQLHLQTTSPLQMRTAAVQTAARLGATAVIIGIAEQSTAHDAASQRGIGATGLSTRYQIDAIDCR